MFNVTFCDRILDHIGAPHAIPLLQSLFSFICISILHTLNHSKWCEWKRGESESCTPSLDICVTICWSMCKQCVQRFVFFFFFINILHWNRSKRSRNVQLSMKWVCCLCCHHHRRSQIFFTCPPCMCSACKYLFWYMLHIHSYTKWTSALVRSFTHSFTYSSNAWHSLDLDDLHVQCAYIIIYRWLCVCVCVCVWIIAA